VDADFSIRAATEADARAIAEIHVAGWRWAYRGMVADELLDSLSVERREEGWKRGLARRAAGEDFPRMWAADQDGRVVGFAAAGPTEDADAAERTGEVYAIYLQPAVVGTGVGRALFAYAVADLRSLGFAQATLWVLEDNTRTRRFYEIAGWRPDGTTKTEDFHGFPLREVRYRIELAS
jgi:L-amino acid N-acyltransferase YncA